MTAPPEPLPRIAYITAGGAGMFCGSCMHDNTLAAALIRLGCDVCLIPSYTPIRTDEESVSIDRVFFGGLNVYLRQRLPGFRFLPSALFRWLDRPSLLNRVASWGLATNGRQLGALAVSMLQGDRGPHRAEVRRLADFIATHTRADLVNLSTILIGGGIPELKRRLQRPIIVTLQGDDLFLEDLPEFYRQAALAEIRRLGEHVDAYFVHSRYYADFMSDYLQLPREKFHVVPLGIRIDDFRAIDRPTSDRHGDGAPAGDNGWLAPRVPLTIGYLARICPEKGFHLLVDAWLRMRQDPRCSDIRLSAAGWLGKHDQPYFEQQLHAIQHAGAADDFSHAGVVNRAGKLRFLAGLDIFSVPTLYREPKGLYVLEALAAGVPVVQPDHGAFPEMLRATGGGKLFHPGDVEDLARVLTELATNPAARRELGEQGRRQVHASCGAAQMAEATLAAFRSVADR